MNALRCPFCHKNVDEAGLVAVCSGCQAVLHAACGLEHACCPACAAPVQLPGNLGLAAGGDDGWRLRTNELGTAYVMTRPRELPSPGTGGRGALTLELLRRQVTEGGLLAGDATLTLHQATRLGPFVLTVVGEQVRPWALRTTRVTEVPYRRLLLLGREPEGSWLRRLVSGRSWDLYSPGCYKISFRVPLDGVPLTRGAPGRTEHHRVLVRLQAQFPTGPAKAKLEVRITAGALAPS